MKYRYLHALFVLCMHHHERERGREREGERERKRGVGREGGGRERWGREGAASYGTKGLPCYSHYFIPFPDDAILFNRSP